MDEERRDDPLGDNRGAEDGSGFGGDVGSSGRVDAGAGLGEGICLKDSRDDRCIVEGNGGRRANGLSFRGKSEVTLEVQVQLVDFDTFDCLRL